MSILNRKARLNYTILQTFETGIVLTGAEVKAIRHGKADLTQAYVKLIDSEPYLVNAIIEADGVTASNVSRKLLLHKREIVGITAEIKGSRLTLIPLKLYNHGSRIKLEIALAKSKKKFEKRALSKKKAIDKQERKDLRA